MPRRAIKPEVDEFATPITPRKSARQAERRKNKADEESSSATSSPSRRKKTAEPIIVAESKNQKQLSRRASTRSNEQNADKNKHMEADDDEERLIIVELNSPERELPKNETPRKESPRKESPKKELQSPKNEQTETPRSRESSPIPVETGHSILFSQAIRAADLDQIKSLIESSDNNVMVATIKGLPSIDALPFLQLVDRTLRQHQKDEKGIPNWLNWIRWANNVLQTHGNHLVTIPNLESHFALLVEWMEDRTQNMDKLLQLQGKLRFLAETAPKNIQRMRNQKPMVVFDFDKNAVIATAETLTTEKKQARMEKKQHFAQQKKEARLAKQQQNEANKRVAAEVEYADGEDEDAFLGEGDRMDLGGEEDGDE